MGEHAVEQQQPDIAQDDAADKVRHEEHGPEDVGAFECLGQHVRDGESYNIDDDCGYDGECRGIPHRMPELFVLERHTVIAQTHGTGISDRREFAEAQVDAQDERQQEANDERLLVLMEEWENLAED